MVSSATAVIFYRLDRLGANMQEVNERHCRHDKDPTSWVRSRGGVHVTHVTGLPLLPHLLLLFFQQLLVLLLQQALPELGTAATGLRPYYPVIPS